MFRILFLKQFDPQSVIWFKLDIIWSVHFTDIMYCMFLAVIGTNVNNTWIQLQYIMRMIWTCWNLLAQITLPSLFMTKINYPIFHIHRYVAKISPFFFTHHFNLDVWNHLYDAWKCQTSVFLYLQIARCLCNEIDVYIFSVEI